MTVPPRIVVLGLSIASSWGNGHATTYRGLLSALGQLGSRVLFLERNVPWYAAHRDFHGSRHVAVSFYDSLAALKRRHRNHVRRADVVLVGSYVPEGREVVDWVQQEARGTLVFYDIDTPVTLSGLRRDSCEYLSRRQLRGFDLYLSFTGGPALEHLNALGARRARPLYCSVDPELHQFVTIAPAWDLGYLGTYAADRQASLREFLMRAAEVQPASRFVVAGAQYPPDLLWPPNVDRIEHVAPPEHSAFYARQRFTLNLTRLEMRRMGYSPSVRLFEAAACGATIISDVWNGIDELLQPYTEFLPARDVRDVEAYLRWPEETRRAIGARARQRVLSAHTARHRAMELLAHVADVSLPRSRSLAPAPARSSGLVVRPSLEAGEP